MRTDYKSFSYPRSAPTHLHGQSIPVDLGGSWMHGIEGAANPIYSLSRLASVSVVKSRWERGALFTADGKRAPEAVVLWWLKIMSDVTEYLEEEIEDPNFSISEAIEEYMALNNLGKEDISTNDTIFLSIRDDTSDTDDDMSETKSVEERLGLSAAQEPVTLSPSLQRALVRVALVIAGEWEWAERMEVLSAKNSFHDGEQLGADVMIPEGYWTIFDRTFMRELQEGTIEYHAKVTKVVQNKLDLNGSLTRSGPLIGPGNSINKSNYSSNTQSVPNSGKVTVTTADGRDFVADRVICTLPLGVLKRYDVKFSPALSDQKTVSMARVGFGTMNKIYVQFENAFWEAPHARAASSPTKTSSKPLLRKLKPHGDSEDAAHAKLESGSSDSLLSTSSSSKHSPRPNSPRYTANQVLTSALDSPPHVLIWLNENGDGRLTVAINHNVIVPHSNILCVMSTGDSVPDIEALSDEKIISELMQRLRHCYGDDLPDPIQHSITRWSRDEYSHGSYASLVLGSSHEDLKELAKMEGKVHFAGEHTNTQYLGSVHGAYLSGMRAATEVLGHFGKAAPEPHRSFEVDEDLKGLD